MNAVVEKKVKQCIREVEKLLGPSFPVRTFALALKEELKLKGIEASVDSHPLPVQTVVVEGLRINVSKQLSTVISDNLGYPEAAWVPHNCVIFPETTRAVA